MLRVHAIDHIALNLDRSRLAPGGKHPTAKRMS
jgi:hypothetical protein